MSKPFKISDETLNRCKIIPANEDTLKQFRSVSTEYLSYLLEAPQEVRFSLYFHMAENLIEFITPREVSEELLTKIVNARDKAFGLSEICMHKKDVPKFFSFITKIRNRKIKAARTLLPGLSAKVIEAYETLSGASQLVVKGGIDQEVAAQVETAAAAMISSQMSSDETLDTLSHLILCDPTLYDHSASVAMFAALIAKKINQSSLIRNKKIFNPAKGFTELDVQSVALGGLYHDVGKTCVPNAILNKPGKFTPEEFEIMKTHTTLGHKELVRVRQQGVVIDEDVIRVALEHHEKFSGGGYPLGLRGRLEENSQSGIHCYSRIVSIADVYSALLMKRVYKEAYDPKSSLEIMKELAKRDFDPDIFILFENAVTHANKHSSKCQLANKPSDQKESAQIISSYNSAVRGRNITFDK